MHILDRVTATYNAVLLRASPNAVFVVQMNGLAIFSDLRFIASLSFFEPDLILVVYRGTRHILSVTLSDDITYH